VARPGRLLPLYLPQSDGRPLPGATRSEPDRSRLSDALFDVVVTPVDATECKPHPAAARLALDRLGAAATEAVFIGGVDTRHPGRARGGRLHGRRALGAVLTRGGSRRSRTTGSNVRERSGQGFHRRSRAARLSSLRSDRSGLGDYSLLSVVDLSQTGLVHSRRRADLDMPWRCRQHPSVA